MALIFGIFLDDLTDFLFVVRYENFIHILYSFLFGYPFIVKKIQFNKVN